MKYQVIETQDFREPKEEWAVVATFETEAEAQTFSELHYDTQIGEAVDTNIERHQCVCESCAEGWRAIDYKSLVVEVQEVK